MPSVYRRMGQGLVAVAAAVLLGPTALAQVQVSPAGQPGNTLSNGNTTRKISVHPNGTIYVCWHGVNGVRVARSLDNGATFGSGVQVTSVDYEAEVAVASTGIVYVAYVEAGQAKVARSLDQGVTFQVPVAAGMVESGQVHMATDGQFVYLVDQPGNHFLRSADNGLTFTSLAIGANQAFSDVHVDPGTHEVLLQVDDPTVKYYTSSDFGSSFGGQTLPTHGGDVYCSVGSLSSGAKGRYLLVSGMANGNLIIDLNTEDASSSTGWPADTGVQTRSLAADIYGNVATGYLSSSNVLFSVSRDLGQTFGAAVTVDAGVTSCAAINTTNGDVLFTYEKSDGSIWFKAFHGLLANYELMASNTNLTFPTQTVNTSSSATTVTVTNQSSSPVTLGGIAVTGDFSQTNDAPATLAPGATFRVNTTFTPTAAGTRAGQVTITYNSGLQRTIALSGTGTATAGVGAPSTQARGLVFSGVGPTQLTLGWTRGNGANCAVFLAQASSGQAAPLSFVDYTASTTFGLGSTACSGWYCVYNGTGNSVTVTGLPGAGTYRAFVCEYNGGSGAESYNTSTASGNPASSVGGGSATVLIPVPPPATATLQSGDTASLTFTVASSGTLSGPVTLSVTGLPTGAAATFTPASVDTSSGPVSVGLTITTTPRVQILGRIQDPGKRMGFGALLACGIFVLPSSRRRKRLGVFLSAFALVLLGGITACSSHGGSTGVTTGGGTAAGTYDVTVMASAQGASSAVSTIRLVVK